MTNIEFKIGSSIPLIIGVSGHKKMVEMGLQDVVKSKLQDLQTRVLPGRQKKIGNKDKVSSVVLTALAEGADQLVARAALDAGIPFIAVLPMPRDIYVQEFEDASEFDRLLKLATWVIELPLPENGDQSKLRLDDGKETLQRKARYQALGAFLASSCDILIALWDGEPLQKGFEGGTAHVVQMMLDRNVCLEGGRYKESLLESSTPGVVLHLKVSRQDVMPGSGTVNFPALANPFPNQKDLEAFVLMKSERECAPSEQTARLLESPDLILRIQKSAASLIPVGKRDLLNDGQRRLLKLYAESDTLAQVYQKRMLNYLLLMLGLGLMAAISATLYSDAELSKPLERFFLLSFFFCLVLGLIAFWIKRGRFWGRQLFSDPEKSHEDFRALAEGLRVQLFWSIYGVFDCVSDHYIVRQHGGLGWMRSFLRLQFLHSLAEPGTEKDTSTQVHRELVRENWVKDQASWFSSKEEAAKKTVSRIRMGSFVLFYLGLFSGLCLLLNPTCGELICKKDSEYLLKMGLSFLPVAAGLLRFYLEFSGKDDLVVQYQRMSVIFGGADKILDKTFISQDERRQMNVVFSLGVEALAENGSWLLMSREKEIKMPD